MSDQILEVIRGRSEVVARGTLKELVALAEQGHLEPKDQIKGTSEAGPVPLHAIPELARLVPTQSEYLVTRSLRALILFDLTFGSLVVLMFLWSVFGTHKDDSSQAEAFRILVLWVGLFGVPLIPLSREKKRLIALRKAGAVGGSVEVGAR